MKRFAAVAVVALLAVACDNATRPTNLTHQRQAGGPSVKGSNDTECVGTLPPGTYDNVVVPEGETCDISGSTVTGNITALSGSHLFANANTVGGNIQADGAATVQIIGGSVGSGIGISDGIDGPNSSDFTVRSVNVTQDIKLTRNTGGILIYQNVLPNGSIVVADNNVQFQMNITENNVTGNINVTKNIGASIFMAANVLPRKDPLDPTSDGPGNIKIEDNDPSFIFLANNGVAQHIEIFRNGGGFKQIFFNSASKSIRCKDNTEPFTTFGNTAPHMEGQCETPSF
jgi:hypothetical protein